MHYNVGAVMGLALTLFMSGVVADEDTVPRGNMAPPVPVTRDLQADARQSQQRGVPIMLMFSAEGCVHCERLEGEMLRPMLGSGDDRVILRKVMLDSHLGLRDFTGKASDAGDIAWRQRVDVTPTLVFVDAQGRQLAPKIVGYQSPEFYWAYVDQAIEASREQLRTR